MRLQNPDQKAKTLIAHTHHMVVATADQSGKPWISPVHFVYDSNYNFYWVSYKKSLHSRSIKVRPQVAISILGQLPDGTYDGVYIDAEAAELTDKQDIQHAIQTFGTRPHSKFTIQTIDDVTGTAAWRIYKAIPKEMSKRADEDTAINGQVVTTRVEVKL